MISDELLLTKIERMLRHPDFPKSCEYFRYRDDFTHAGVPPHVDVRLSPFAGFRLFESKIDAYHIDKVIEVTDKIDVPDIGSVISPKSIDEIKREEELAERIKKIFLKAVALERAYHETLLLTELEKYQ